MIVISSEGVQDRAQPAAQSFLISLALASRSVLGEAIAAAGLEGETQAEIVSGRASRREAQGLPAVLQLIATAQVEGESVPRIRAPAAHAGSPHPPWR